MLFWFSDPLSPENVLTDYLEPLPDPGPTDPVTPPPGPDPVTPQPDVPVPDTPPPVPDLSYHFDFPLDCGRRPTFGLSDYERRLQPAGHIERTRVVGGTAVATGTYPWQVREAGRICGLLQPFSSLLGK